MIWMYFSFLFWCLLIVMAFWLCATMLQMVHRTPKSNLIQFLEDIIDSIEECTQVSGFNSSHFYISWWCMVFKKRDNDNVHPRWIWSRFLSCALLWKKLSGNLLKILKGIIMQKVYPVLKGALPSCIYFT